MRQGEILGYEKEGSRSSAVQDRCRTEKDDELAEEIRGNRYENEKQTCY